MGGRSLRHPMTPLRRRIGALVSFANMIGHHGLGSCCWPPGIEMTGPIKKARKQQELDELAFNVLSSFRHQGAMQWTDWHETTSARRGKVGLGTGTFSAIAKRLMAQGRVQVDGDGCYRVVDGVIPAANAPAAGTERFSEVIPEGGNGTSPIARDIADIALQQLLDRVQDS